MNVYQALLRDGAAKRAATEAEESMTTNITIPIALLEQLVNALEATIPLMDKVWSYDGDVFGKLHNDAVDSEGATKEALTAGRAALEGAKLVDVYAITPKTQAQIDTELAYVKRMMEQP